MIEFKKSSKSDSFFVYKNDKLIGNVRKVAHWTVRGDRIEWIATRCGVTKGRGATRREAAKSLDITV